MARERENTRARPLHTVCRASIRLSYFDPAVNAEMAAQISLLTEPFMADGTFEWLQEILDRVLWQRSNEEYRPSSCCAPSRALPNPRRSETPSHSVGTRRKRRTVVPSEFVTRDMSTLKPALLNFWLPCSVRMCFLMSSSFTPQIQHCRSFLT